MIIDSQPFTVVVDYQAQYLWSNNTSLEISYLFYSYRKKIDQKNDSLTQTFLENLENQKRTVLSEGDKTAFCAP